MPLMALAAVGLDKAMPFMAERQPQFLHYPRRQLHPAARKKGGGVVEFPTVHGDEPRCRWPQQRSPDQKGVIDPKAHRPRHVT